MSRAHTAGEAFDRAAYFEGFKVGIPIALGYLVVSFSLGVVAGDAGLTAFQGGLASLLCAASAGEYAGFASIASNASYLAIIFATLAANCRYVLMGCALGQRCNPSTSILVRALVALGLTDEIFGVSVMRPGYVNPKFIFGCMTVTVPFWTVGTVLGVMVGNILPTQWASVLSVALFGMFLAIIVPPGRKNALLGVLVTISFACSYLASIMPVTRQWSEGSRVAALTVVLTSAAALLFPIDDAESESAPETPHDAAPAQSDQESMS